MRSLATLIVGLLLLLLQSTVMEFAPVHLVTPTLGLLTVLYIGLSPLKWAPGAAALVGLSLGYLFDLVSGAPRGVHAFVFLVMALFARVLASRLAVRGVVLKAAALRRAYRRGARPGQPRNRLRRSPPGTTGSPAHGSFWTARAVVARTSRRPPGPGAAAGRAVAPTCARAGVRTATAVIPSHGYRRPRCRTS